MSEVLVGAVCGVDGCTPAALDHFGTASGAKATLAIDVISDAICPWCWVAKRRLDSAIAALAPDVTATVLAVGNYEGGPTRRAWHRLRSTVRPTLSSPPEIISLLLGAGSNCASSPFSSAGCQSGTTANVPPQGGHCGCRRHPQNVRITDWGEH